MSEVNTGAPAPQADSIESPVAPETNEVEGQVEAGAAAEAPKKEEPKAESKRGKKKFELKVDGAVDSIEVDLDNEEELKRHLQMSKAAQKRMQQFAEYEKGVKGLFEALQKDPLKVLSDPRLGISEDARKKMAEAIINNEIEEMQKTPEQREKERLQREFEALKKQHEEEKQAREQAEFKRLQDQAAQQLDLEISQAIEQAKLPKTARTVRYMAEAMMFALQNGLDLAAKDLVPYIKKSTLSDFREIISSLPDEEFEDWLGKDQISRIRKRNLQKVKQIAETASAVKPTAEAAKAKEEAKEPKKMLAKDFFRTLGR